jgi:hypothetical protein
MLHTRKPPEGLGNYCLAPGGFASGVGTGAAGSAEGEVSRSSGGAKQSPATIRNIRRPTIRLNLAQKR